MQLNTPERKRQFVDNYVLSELLAEKGRAEGYDKDPEVARQVEDLRRRLVVQRVMKDLQEPPALSDDEVRTYYEENKRLFSGSQVRASHILVKDEETAKRLREELRQDPSEFEDLAKEHSTDTATASRGGDLGFFGQGRMVGEFERAAFALEKPGEMTEVVKTPFGYHIIKLVERKEGAEKPFDEVKDRIRVTLLNQRRQAHVNEQFEKLKQEAKLEVNDAVLAKVEVPPPAPGKPGGPPLPGASPGTAPAPAEDAGTGH
jgi:peptidyl-prolyl cis-trans isomerase C